MTGHQINSLVGDLVAMAQAMERLPQVEAALAEWQDMASKRTDEIMRLNEDLKQSKDYAASLEAKVHAAEASRDDAELRFLELDEKAAGAINLAGTATAALAGITEMLNPPQPEPIVSEVRAIDNPLYDDPQVSEVKPIVADPTDPISNPAQYFHGGPTSQPADHSGESVGINPQQGQSEADPMAVHTPEPLSHSVPTPSVSSSEDASSPSWAAPTPPKPQPYAGKRYHDWPKYVSLTDWLDGGGTEQNYYY